jgi:hypothetical protein
MGWGNVPQIDKTPEDYLPGKFAREIGPENLRVILNSPYGDEPGIPVNHMLYLLDNIELEKMIKIVRDTGARRVVNLINAVKRHGCNKPSPETPDIPRFNIPFDDVDSVHYNDYPNLDLKKHHMDCSLNDFDYLNLTIELIDKIEETETLVKVICQEKLGSRDNITLNTEPTLGLACLRDKNLSEEETLSEMKIYLEKVAFLVVYLKDTDRLSVMINGVIYPHDIVYFVDQFDNERCLNPAYETKSDCENNTAVWYEKINVPAAIKDILDGSALSGLNKLILTLQKIEDPNKLYQKINGLRCNPEYEACNLSEQLLIEEDNIQIDYIKNKLIPLLEGSENIKTKPPGNPDVHQWITKLTSLFNDVNDIRKMVELEHLFETIHITNIIYLIENLNSPEDTPPANNAIRTTAELINGIKDQSKLVTILEKANSSKMADLTNDISTTSRFDDDGREDLGAAGKKMASVIDSIDNFDSFHCSDPAYTDDAPGSGCSANGETWFRSKLERLSNLINYITVPEKLARLIDYLSITNSFKLGELVNSVNSWQNVKTLVENIDSPLNPDPSNNAIRTIGFVIDNIDDSQKIVYLIDNVSPANMASLLNDVGTGSQVSDDLVTEDLLAAGKKMINIINNTDDIQDMEFLVNQVSNVGQMSSLINALKISSTPKVATLTNNITGTNCWLGTGGTCSSTIRGEANGLGKLVNLIDYITTLGDTAELIDNVDDGQKLADFINYVTNSSNITGFINAVLAADPDSDASLNDLVGLMNNINTSDGNKLAGFINELSILSPAEEFSPPPASPQPCLAFHGGAFSAYTCPSIDHVLLAQLIAPEGGTGLDGTPNVGWGSGYMSHAYIIQELDDPDAGGRMAKLFRDLNDFVCYHEDCAFPTLPKREALVRIIRIEPGSGVTFDPGGFNVPFPGLGPHHIATMMNRSEVMGLDNILNMLNGTTDIEDMIVLVGCGDRVGAFENPPDSGIWTWLGSPHPDFQTSCTAIGQW